MGIVKPIYPHNFVDGSRGGEFKTKNLLGKTELVENFLPTAKRNVVQQVEAAIKNAITAPSGSQQIGEPYTILHSECLLKR